MRKPNSIIVLLYIFHIIHPQKQKPSVQPFCFWGEHSKGLSNQADVELGMINAKSAADMAFIMSSSQAIGTWLNALDQSDFSWWVWCIIIERNGQEARQTSKKETNRARFTLKGPWPYPSFVLCSLIMHELHNRKLLLVSSMSTHNKILYFARIYEPKIANKKHTNFVWFYNYFPLLTMVAQTLHQVPSTNRSLSC